MTGMTVLNALNSVVCRVLVAAIGEVIVGGDLPVYQWVTLAVMSGIQVILEE